MVASYIRPNRIFTADYNLIQALFNPNFLLTKINSKHRTLKKIQA